MCVYVVYMLKKDSSLLNFKIKNPILIGLKIKTDFF